MADCALLLSEKIKKWRAEKSMTKKYKPTTHQKEEFQWAAAAARRNKFNKTVDLFTMQPTFPISDKTEKRAKENTNKN